MNMLTTEELSEVAFGLLTSSSIERYEEVAMRAADGLISRIRRTPFVLPQVFRRAQMLWGDAFRSDQREPLEAELAVLIAVLCKTAVPRVDAFLRSVALCERKNVQWLAGLARRAHSHRSSSMSIATTNPLDVQPRKVVGVRIARSAASSPPRIESAPSSLRIVMKKSGSTQDEHVEQLAS